MFLSTSPIFQSGSVPSGSIAVAADIWDVSPYKTVQMQAIAADGIAGTASVYVASLPWWGGSPTGSAIKNSQPYTPANLLFTMDVPEAQIGVDSPTTSSTVPFSAKWMYLTFEATSGSTPTTTGSVFINLTLQQ